MIVTNAHKQKGGYSIIAAVLMIGFLLILTTSTMNLVLQEMQDGKGKQDYMKAYAGAEGALELALLRIKQEGYGYDDDSFQGSEILGSGNKIPKLSYEFESRVTSHSGILVSYETDIIPLFSTGTVIGSVSSLSLSSATPDIIWNIITKDGGVSGIGGFNQGSPVGEKTYNEVTGKLEYAGSMSVGSALTGKDYLILYNPSSSPLQYKLDSTDGFTLPRAVISSSAQVGKYSQNLQTVVDNTKFLGILKYSIYSGN